jgi:hypothetical protein
MEVVFFVLIFFIGAVVFFTWSELQGVDKIMWQKDTEMKQKVRKLESDIVDLNRTISELKNELAESEKDED